MTGRLVERIVRVLECCMVELVWLCPRDRSQPVTAPAIANQHAKSKLIRDRSQPPTAPAITGTGRLVERIVRVLECCVVGLVWLCPRDRS